MSRSTPWLRGPYQLIEHASGHLKDGGDGDCIIALIGFYWFLQAGMAQFDTRERPTCLGLSMSSVPARFAEPE